MADAQKVDASTVNEFNANSISEAAAMNFIANNPLQLSGLDFNKANQMYNVSSSRSDNVSEKITSGKCQISSSRALMQINFRKHNRQKTAEKLDFLFDTGASVSLMSPTHFASELANHGRATAHPPGRGKMVNCRSTRNQVGCP